MNLQRKAQPKKKTLFREKVLPFADFAKGNLNPPKGLFPAPKPMKEGK